MSILNQIVARKKDEVAFRKGKHPEKELLKSIYFDKLCYSLSSFILDPKRSGIIAEFKRKSPSKPNINLNADVQSITNGYSNAGASALSVLTDVDFFGGSDRDFEAARDVNNIPMLRKDFVISPYQIIEAKSLGADAILLIAEILTKNEVNELSKIANDCGMEVLMEIHTADQIAKYHERIRNIGVNNRNLKTFETNVEYSKEILPQLPVDAIKVSESGINQAEIVVSLKKLGYNGFLIGENFMKTENPSQACQHFIESINQLT